MKASTLPYHEYTYQFCFLGGGEKLTSESINLVEKLGYLGGEKLGRSVIFPPWQVKASTLPCHEYTYQFCLLGGGEKLGWPILSPPWQVKASTLPCHEYTYQFCFLGGGEKLGRPILSPPWLVKINLMQKLGYLGGEKLGQPILSPPWLVKVSTLPWHEYANNLCFLGGGEKLGWPILSPSRQDKASTLCRWLSEWRKTWLVHYFPTLTSESINLTLSWIHIPILHFRGWGKTD